MHAHTHSNHAWSQEANSTRSLPRKWIKLEEWIRLRMASSVFLVTFRRASVFWWLKWESNSRAPSSNTSVSFFFLANAVKGRRPGRALREDVEVSKVPSSLFAVTEWEKLKEIGADPPFSCKSISSRPFTHVNVSGNPSSSEPPVAPLKLFFYPNNGNLKNYFPLAG